MPILVTPSTPFHPQQLNTFPLVIVEAAFGPASPVPGEFDLLLDDPAVGLLDHDVLADSDTWTDISQWVQDGTVTRQSTRQQGPQTTYQGGTATFTLNNSDGRFDPANLSGPYVAGGVTQVRPMIPVRVRAVWNLVTYYVFSGFATSWIPPAENFGPVYDQTVLTCGDAFRIFAGYQLPTLGAAVGSAEETGDRIGRILTAAGWYSSARNMAVVAEGDSTLQGTTFGDYALTLMQLATDSEAGELYIDGQGAVVFRNRRAPITDARSVTPQGCFGGVPGTIHYSDGGGVIGTEYECTAVSRPDDDTTMANDIQATITGSSNMQEVQNAESIARFLFPRTYQRTDLILQTDTDALQWANWILGLSADDEFRFDEVTITPGVDPGDLFPQALGRELGDRIQVTKRPPNVAPYTKDLLIRGIQHTFTPTWWQTVWTTQQAARYSYFVLDDDVLGVLDVDTLAW